MTETAVSPQALRDQVVEALDDMKAVDPRIIDVRGRTAITDFMAFATGNSRRHVRAIADAVIDAARDLGLRPTGVEGLEGSEWVLVDLGDVVVHVMLEDVRDFYRLERIWGVDEAEA
ncbi:ribosome silencing factor [Spiribacter onubensis]|jgi:ribosome-associated protein|uniref:Ribosomal silencing factor RsfS n=1 Tax=Spiribacter onubensis TaxID=3122420 RepID=A0ABV3S5M9_9GAMM